jgi:hypothetical protein
MKIVLRRINQKMVSFVVLGLFAVIGSGSRRAEAARVHLIAVGDTLDKDIGKSIEEDLDSLVGTFEQIGKKSLLEPVVLKGVVCNPTAINESLDKLHIHSGDAVVFYFTGHGAYDKENGQFLQIPRLGKDGDVSRNQLRDKLKGWVDARQIRLGVLMTDMCNLQKIIAMPNPPPPGAAGAAAPFDDLPIFKALFVDSEGFVDVSSASTNEAAATYPKFTFPGDKEGMCDGSIYSTVFSNLLRLHANDRLSWETFLIKNVAPKVRSEFQKNFKDGIDLPDGVSTQRTQTVMINSVAILQQGNEFRGEPGFAIPSGIDVFRGDGFIGQDPGNGIYIAQIGVTVSRKLFPRNINGKFLNGVRIISIDPDAPVNASWEPGDVIYSINGVEVGNIQRFKQLVANPGNASFGAWWKASIQQMVRRQPIVLRGNGRANGPVNGRIRLGVVPEVQIYTVQTDNGPQNGVRIASIVPGTPADNRMVDPGDIVLSINGIPTPTLEEFYEAISKADGVIEIWGFNSATGNVENFRPIPLS